MNTTETPTLPTPGVSGTPRCDAADAGDILSRLDMRVEYAALGLRVDGQPASADGWLPCHAMGREDRNASAAINLQTGRYKDHGTGESLSFWDFAAKYGNYPTWQAARDHYAAKVGVEPHRNTNGRAVRKPKTPTVFADPKDAISFLEQKLGRRDAIWKYHDVAGNVVGATVRWNTPNGKEIRPITKCGNGWAIGAMPEPRPIYDLPAILPAPRVYVGEGEKVCEAGKSIGLVMTTSPGGAQGARRADWSPLAGKEVVGLRDNDAPGLTYVNEVGQILWNLSPRPTFRLLTLPGLAEGEDLADWIDHHGDAAEPDSMREEIEAMVAAAPVWTPATIQAPVMKANVCPPVEPGTRVRALDRDNFGEVTSDNGESCTVHFVSPEGQHADVELPKVQLVTQDGRRLDGSVEPAREFKVYSMADLDALDLHVDMVIARVLMVGAPGVIGGTFKTLKTSFALEQGLSMALGVGAKYLEHFDVLRRAVSVYFAGEGGLVPLRETLRRQCQQKRVALRDVQAFYLCDEVPRLDSDADLAAVISILQDRKAEFAFFDPAYLMFGEQAASAGNVYAMGTILGRMLRACREAGSTPIILHHFNRLKGNLPNTAPDLADLSQAGCAELAGQWQLIGRVKSYDPEQPGEHDLVLSIGSRIGFSSKWAVHVSEGSLDGPEGRYWRPEAVPFSESKRQEKDAKAARKDQQDGEKAQKSLEAARKTIVEAAVKLDRPATRREIQDRTPIQDKRFGKAWASLVDDGILIEVGKARLGNNQTISTWKVETNSDEV